jgi:hypothetical protein
MLDLGASRAAKRVVTFSQNLKLECPGLGHTVNEMDLNQKTGLIVRNDRLVGSGATALNRECRYMRVQDGEPTANRALRL